MTNPNWVGLCCAAAALAAFFISHHVARQMAWKRRGLFALSSVILAIPGASFAIYYAHLVSEPAWYYEFRSWRGTEALLIFMGIAGGFTAAFLPRLSKALPLVVVGAFVIVPFLKPLVGSIPEGALRDRWDGDVCMQSTPSTCGAASMASILYHHGMIVPESALAHEAHSYIGGTEIWYLARAAHKRGFKTRTYLTSDFDPEIPLPAIVGVRYSYTGHFIAILSRHNNKFHVGDPLRGSEMLSFEELSNRYTFTGFHMSISKAQ